MSSDANTIMESLATAIDQQWFLLGGQVLTAFVRKLPLRQEDIDPQGMIIVCPGGPEKFKRFAFNGHYTVEIGIMVVVIAANNGAEGQPDALLAIRQTIAGIVSAESPARCLKVTIDYDPVFDVNAIAENYDYSALEGRFLLAY